MPTATIEPKSKTLDAPGATLAYDVRPNDTSTEPVLFLIGSPMGAGGFGTLAGHFSDRTVATYDPRGSERSTKTDPMSTVNPASTPTTCIASFKRSAAGPSTYSPAAAVPSTRWRSLPATQATSGRSSPTSRRWRRCSPTVRTPRPQPARSMRPTSAAAGAPAWPTSSSS